MNQSKLHGSKQRSSPLRRYAVVGLIGALALGALSALFLALGDGATAARGADSNAAVPSPWRAGDQHVYELTMDHVLAAPEGEASHLALEGTWTVTVLSATEEGVELAVRVGDGVLTSRLSADATAAERLRAAGTELDEPLFVSLDSRGAIAEVAASSDMRTQVRSILKSIAAQSQAVAPPFAGASSWEATERDSTGAYLARYEPRDGLIRKRKLRYETIEGSNSVLLNKDANVEVVSAEAHMSRGPDGGLESLTLDEELAFEAEGLPELLSVTRLTLQRKDRRSSVATEALLAARALLRGFPIASHGLGPRAWADADHQRVAGRDFQTLLDALASAPKDTDDRELRSARRRAFSAMAALMRLDGKAVDAAMDEIASGSPDSRTLWNALGSAGSPQAQTALRELVGTARFDDNERLSQMISLSMVAQPTPDTVAFLVETMDDEVQGTQARYGVGAAAYSLRDVDPERARQAVDVLVERLEAAQDKRRKAELLRAIGNAGHPSALAVARPYLNDPSPMLRSEALRAIRRIESPEVDPIVVRAARTDDEAVVRRAALEILGSRPPTADGTATLRHAASSDDDRTARRIAARGLAHHGG